MVIPVVLVLVTVQVVLVRAMLVLQVPPVHACQAEEEVTVSNQEAL